MLGQRMALFSILCLLMWCMTGAGCNAFDELELGGQSGPYNRGARRSNARCFDTFDQFKAAMEKAGKSKRGDGMEWHHIVPQHADNVARFGAHDLHCTDNLVYIESAIHHRINGHYSSKHPSGKLVRDWLKTQSFDAQYDYGIDMLVENKVKL